MGAVALHGIRTADVKLGDLVAVIGLGLLGQLTVQILNAASCRVLGMDIVPERAELALRHGAEAATSSPSEFRDLCFQNSSRAGVDAVLITAETASSEPVNLAGEIARDRATVVAVGTSSVQPTIAKNSTFASRVLMVRAATIRPSNRKAAIIPSATCVGPRRATWMRSSVFLPAANWRYNR